MSDRKIVYQGPSGIGQVIVYEGDYVEFDFHGNTPDWCKGYAFYQPNRSPWSNECIKYRSPYFRQYSSEIDFHFQNPSQLKILLVHHTGKCYPKTGFGGFIQKIEEKL